MKTLYNLQLQISQFYNVICFVKSDRVLELFFLLVEKTNSRGPKTDPCGTPILVSFHSLNTLSILILCFAIQKMILNEFKAVNAKSISMQFCN